MEAATRLLGQYGFQGTTLALVADAVGLTEPGVLHYYPSKVHLLQAVLEHHEQKDLEQYLAASVARQQNAPELFKLLEGLVAQNEKIPGLIQLFTVLVGESIRSDHPSHDYFVERYRHGREMYVRHFFTSLKDRIPPDVDVKELSALIMAVMDGLQIQWLLDPKKVDMTKTFNLFSRIILKFLEEH